MEIIESEVDNDVSHSNLKIPCAPRTLKARTHRNKISTNINKRKREKKKKHSNNHNIQEHCYKCKAHFNVLLSVNSEYTFRYFGPYTQIRFV